MLSQSGGILVKDPALAAQPQPTPRNWLFPRGGATLIYILVMRVPHFGCGQAGALVRMNVYIITGK